MWEWCRNTHLETIVDWFWNKKNLRGWRKSQYHLWSSEDSFKLSSMAGPYMYFPGCLQMIGQWTVSWGSPPTPKLGHQFDPQQMHWYMTSQRTWSRTRWHSPASWGWRNPGQPRCRWPPHPPNRTAVSRSHLCGPGVSDESPSFDVVDFGFSCHNYEICV